MTTGSRVACGCDAWPPRPTMVIINSVTWAIVGPGTTATTPTGTVGQLWWPYTCAACGPDQRALKGWA